MKAFKKTSETSPFPITDSINIETIQHHLKTAGVIVIRNGMEMHDYEALTRKLTSHCLIHHGTGTGQRDTAGSEKSTATVDKGTTEIPLHREYAYAAGGPDLMMFYCITPAKERGETILCDGQQVMEALTEDLRTFAEEAVLKWHWKVPSAYWQTTLDVTSQEEALKKLHEIQASCPSWESQEVQFDGDMLEGTFQTRCATFTKWGNQRAFCNYLPNFFFRETDEYYKKPPITLTLEDGSPFPLEKLKKIKAYTDQYSVAFKWQPTDVVIIDNSRFMHGRNGFSDPNRNIVVRMGKANF